MTDSSITEYDTLFIGGKWTAPATDRVIEVRSPATGEYVGKVPLATKADVDNAVAAMTSIIEPLLIIFLALVVGTIVIALFMPILKLQSVLGRNR